MQIAKRTGFTAGHVSHVLQGKKMIGDRFARALLEMWGLDWDNLMRNAGEVRMLLKQSGPLPMLSTLPVDPMPNLRETMNFVRAELPKAFLDEFEAEGRSIGIDEPRFAWIDMLKADFWSWKRARRLEDSGSQDRRSPGKSPPIPREGEPSGTYRRGDHKAAASKERARPKAKRRA